MGVSGLDAALWISGMIGESLLFGILCWRRQYRVLPVFVALSAWLAVTGPILLLVVLTHHSVSSLLYLRVYYACSAGEYLLELGVLVEIAANVIRPVRKSLPGS